MRIAVIGAGPVGRAVGGGWARAGHAVHYGVRSAGPGVTTVADALDSADAVLLAVPGDALPAVLDEHAGRLDGRLVVDASNLVGAAALHQVPLLTARLPAARIARAFCTVGHEVLADPVFDGQAADLFWCGPDGADGDLVAGLVRDTGARPVRVGGLDAADVVDGVARLWFALTFGQGRGREHALKVLDRA
jgi:8-hydroxy-5-deazaflavin:NADPH oxidoreductase